jgi:hypothetical protein
MNRWNGEDDVFVFLLICAIILELAVIWVITK